MLFIISIQLPASKGHTVVFYIRVFKQHYNKKKTTTKSRTSSRILYLSKKRDTIVFNKEIWDPIERAAKTPVTTTNHINHWTIIIVFFLLSSLKVSAVQCSGGKGNSRRRKVLLLWTRRWSVTRPHSSSFFHRTPLSLGVNFQVQWRGTEWLFGRSSPLDFTWNKRRPGDQKMLLRVCLSVSLFLWPHDEMILLQPTDRMNP